MFHCDLISLTTPTCYSTFYRCAMVPTVVKNPIFFMYLFVNFFVNKFIMTSEPMPTASWHHVSQLYPLLSEK